MPVHTAVGTQSLAACEGLEPRWMLSLGFAPLPSLGNVGGTFAVADFDGDGVADVAAPPDPGENSPALLRIWKGNGLGGFIFLSAALGGPGETITNPANADVDGDGDQDILARGAGPAAGLRLFLNDGAGHFDAGTLLAGTSDVTTFRFAEFTGDNLPDVFALSASSVRVLRNTGGIFEAQTPTTVAAGLSLVSIADLNADTAPDVVLFAPNLAIHVILNNGDNTFSTTPLFAIGEYAPVLADTNRDGVADLVACWSSGIWTARGRGDGSFELRTQITPSTVPASIRFTVVAAVDFGDPSGPGLVVSQNRDAGRHIELRIFNNDGTGAYAAAEFITLVPSFNRQFTFANFAGDSRPDLAVFNAGLAFAKTVTGASLQTATISDPRIVPGANFTLTTQGVVFSQGSTQQTVRFYRSYTGEGLPTNLLGTSSLVLLAQAVQTAPNEWSATRLLTDDQIAPGDLDIVAVVADSAGSSFQRISSQVWTRLFYPDGFRNDASINEYVSLANPNDVPVDYRIVARYESGERDQVVGTGTLAPTSRGGITVVEHGAVDVVRAGVGYTLEVQSTLPIGATFSHYDNFGSGPESGTATGEAFTNISSSNWGFANLSTASFDFLLFYNPYETTINITVAFQQINGSAVTYPLTVGGLRRAGIALRDVVQFAPNASMGASVSATGAVAAALTRYDPAAGSGFATWGLRTSSSATVGAVIVPYFDTTAGSVNTLTLYNPQGLNDIATLRISFSDGRPDSTQTINLPAFGRVETDLATLVPAGAGTASIRITSFRNTVLSQVINPFPDRHDSAAGAVASYAASHWALGDAFMNTPLAGQSFFETLNIFNPGTTNLNVRVRYLFTDGTFAERTVAVVRGRGATINLHEEPAILQHAANTWFAVDILAPEPSSPRVALGPGAGRRLVHHGHPPHRDVRNPLNAPCPPPTSPTRPPKNPIPSAFRFR